MALDDRRSIARVIPLLALTTIVACGGDDEAGGGGDEFRAMVERVPASALESEGGGEPTFYFSDMAIRWEQLDLADAGADERLDRSFDLSEVETFTIGPQLFERALQVQLDEARTEVGFTTFDIDREAMVVQPPRSTTVAGVAIGVDARRGRSLRSGVVRRPR